MAEHPALYLWTDAYLADTMHMSCLESGAYLHLLMAAWRSPECSLPDDDTKLGRMARCTPREWRKVRDTVMALWTFDEKTKTWTQKRLLREQQRAREKSVKAKLAAEAKWLKNKDSDDADASSKHSAEQCPSDAIPEPEPEPLDSPLNPPKGERRKKLNFNQALEANPRLQEDCIALAKRLFAEHGWPDINFALLWEEFAAYWGGEKPRAARADWPRTFYNRAMERRTWRVYDPELAPAERPKAYGPDWKPVVNIEDGARDVIADLWRVACVKIARITGPAKYESWIGPLILVRATQEGSVNIFEVMAPSRYHIDHVKQEFASDMERLLGDRAEIRFVVSGKNKPKTTESHEHEKTAAA